MKITRRKMLSGCSAIGLAVALPKFAFGARTAVAGHEPEPWFAQTTFDLGKDLSAATAAGKHLALLWERDGCTYCDTLHSVNFQIEEIVAAGKADFHTVQMDLWGDREFTDFDGDVLSEETLAQKYRVRATPTTLFFNADAKEAFRMPGYAPPLLHMAVYGFVAEEGFKTASLQEWIKTKYSEE